MFKSLPRAFLLKILKLLMMAALCITISLLTFALIKDKTSLILGTFICIAISGYAVFLFIIALKKKYYVVEACCIGIDKRNDKYKPFEVFFIDGDYAEFSIFVTKNENFKIQRCYKLFFNNPKKLSGDIQLFCFEELERDDFYG